MEPNASTTTEANPRIRVGLRVFMVVPILVLVTTGIMLFFFTEYARTVWPWELTPFNARFIGGFYLGSIFAAAIIVMWPRWSPARVLTTQICLFTSLVLLVSLAYTGRFFFDRPLTWAWFGLYVLVPSYTLYAVWAHRSLHADTAPTPRGISAFLTVSGAILGAYGIGLLIAPVALTEFWPWPVDAFHGRLYAAVFLSPAFTAVLLRARSAAADRIGVGVVTSLGSVLIVAGTVVTDASKGSVDWASPGTWLWVGAFAAMAVFGLTVVTSGRGSLRGDHAAV